MSLRPEARRYRHVLQYQEATDAPDDFGEPIRTWATVATYRAEVRGLTGREVMLSEQMAASLTTAVVHRFVAESEAGRPKVTGRYLFGARVLSIASVVDPTGEGHELKALCTEDAASS